MNDSAHYSRTGTHPFILPILMLPPRSWSSPPCAVHVFTPLHAEGSPPATGNITGDPASPAPRAPRDATEFTRGGDLRVYTRLVSDISDFRDFGVSALGNAPIGSNWVKCQLGAD